MNILFCEGKAYHYESGLVPEGLHIEAATRAAAFIVSTWPEKKRLLWNCWLLVIKWECVCLLSQFSHVWVFMTLWTIALQAPLSMGFSRWEYWNGLWCPPPGDLPHPGIEPVSLMSPALAGGLFTSSTTWETQNNSRCHNTKWTIQNTYFIPSVNFEYVESLLVVEKWKLHWTGRQSTKLPPSLPLFNFSEFRYFIDKLVMIGERPLESLHFLGTWGWIF